MYSIGLLRTLQIPTCPLQLIRHHQRFWLCVFFQPVRLPSLSHTLTHMQSSHYFVILAPEKLVGAGLPNCCSSSSPPLLGWQTASAAMSTAVTASVWGQGLAAIKLSAQVASRGMREGDEECHICRDDIPATIAFVPCKHKVCFGCMENMRAKNIFKVNPAAAGGLLVPLRCPGAQLGPHPCALVRQALVP
jgi:hypothetical protein